MAHKTREPERMMRAKMTKPRDRGEKYVAPQILPEERAGRAWSTEETSAGTVGSELRRRRLERTGEAHSLIQKLDFAILRVLARR
jgi:hypothetical protein